MQGVPGIQSDLKAVYDEIDATVKKYLGPATNVEGKLEYRGRSYRSPLPCERSETK